MAAIVRANGLSDGRYIEPYAGGAGIAWELLITGVVRRVLINDVSPHVFAFWTSVLSHTDELCRRIRDVPLSVEEWDHQKEIFRRPKDASTIDLGVSCFYLNRTNRSGILNGGPIGGRNQEGEWRMDARFNRENLVRRITKIADCRGRIEVSCADAVEFLREKSGGLEAKDLIYVDPPYFEKGSPALLRRLRTRRSRRGSGAVVEIGKGRGGQCPTTTSTRYADSTSSRPAFNTRSDTARASAREAAR